MSGLCYVYNNAVVAIRPAKCKVHCVRTSWWEVRMAARIKQASTRYQKGALMSYIFRNASRVPLLYSAKSDVYYRCDA